MKKRSFYLVLGLCISLFTVYGRDFKMTMQSTGPGMLSSISVSKDGSLFAVTYPHSDKIYVWNVYGKLFRVIHTGTGTPPGSPAISRDNRYVAYIVNSQTIHIADIQSGKVANLSGEPSQFATSMLYSLEFGENDTLYAGFVKMKMLNIPESLSREEFSILKSKSYSDEVTKSLNESYLQLKDSAQYVFTEKNEHFSNIISLLSIAGYSTTLASPEMVRGVVRYIVSEKSSRVLYKTPGSYTAYINMIAVHDNKKEMLIYSIDGTIVRLSLTDYSVISETKADPNLYYNSLIKYSQDGRFSGWVSSNGVRVINSRNVYAVNRTAQITAGDIDLDGQYTVELSMEYDADKNISYQITMRDFDRMSIRTLCRPEKDGYILRILPGGKNTVYGMSNGVLGLINNETGDIVYLLSDDKGEWISYTPDGYWDGSRNAGVLISMTSGLEVYGIDQFAAYYNRPDIVISRIGAGNENLIKYYHVLYKKRLKRMKLSDELNNSEPPVSEIVSLVKNGKMANVEFNIESQSGIIAAYNIFVNDTPVYGASGKEVNALKKNIKETVELTGGTNKIEVTCINEFGIESYRAVGYLTYDNKAKGDLYYLGFGVSKYKDPVLNLGYAAKDVRDLKNLFSTMKQYAQVFSYEFTDERCTKDVFVRAKKLIAMSKPDDTVLICIAGHGVLDMTGIEPTYYYLTHEAQVNDLASSAVDFDTIESLFQGISARNKVFFMDTCESGEEKDSIASLLADSSRISSGTEKIRGFNRGLKKESAAVTGEIRKSLLEKDRYIYNDLIRRTGAVVFSSSQGSEYSYEDEKLQNGYFTHYILKAFSNLSADSNKDGFISMNELRLYVTEGVSTLSGGLQNPTIDRDNIYQEIRF